MNLLSIFQPTQFLIDTPTIRGSRSKPKPPSSHLYLGQIQALKQQIEDLEYRNHQLELQRDMKVYKEVSKRYNDEKKSSSKMVNRSTLNNLKYLRRNTLQYPLGHDKENNLIIQDLSTEPHLLISGKTGSGKSVTMFNILISLLSSNSPNKLKISLIDPKLLSFGDKRIEGSPYLNEKPSIGCNEQALKILENAYSGMMKRYKLMLREGVKDYRDIGLHAHVIFIDEVFELLEGGDSKEILSLITRIASLGRAGGVHLVLATQSPRAKTLSGILKANLEFIGHRMSSPTESRLIELPDAHNLKGKGDGLKILQGSSDITRFQSLFIELDEDKTYKFFHSGVPKSDPIQAKNGNDPKQTQNDPILNPTESAQNTIDLATRELKQRMVETMGEDGKIKPKSSFITSQKRDELLLWSKALNELKADEIIAYRNGKGYYVVADYHTALSVIDGGA